MKKVRRVAGSVAWALALVAVLGVPVYAAFTAALTIIETDSVTYAQLSADVPLNVDFLAANSFIDADGRDTRVMLGLTELPHMLASDRLVFNTALTADTSQALSFTTENSQISNFVLSTVRGGRITIADDAGLELDDDFAVLFEGVYLDTDAGADKNLVYKQNAFKIYIQAGGTIRVAFLAGGDAETLSVDATGVTSGVHSVLAVIEIR